jgi:multidrug efflux pump
MFSHFFIDRPIFASVLSIVIVLVGGVAVVTLPVEQYPDIVPPTIQVTANYPGADGKVVAETVASPIEQEVNGVEDMLYMSSSSSNDGQMNLDITFKLGTDLDQAQVLVQNRVATAIPQLPQEVQRTGVTTKKKSPSILLVVNLFSPENTHSYLFLSNYATTKIKDRLARIEGVGDVAFLGARDYSMRIWLDPGKMSQRKLTTTDITRVIEEQNKQVAAGRLGAEPTPDTTDFTYTLTSQGRLLRVEEFEDIIIRADDRGQIIRLKDVARVELGAKNYDVNSYLTSKEPGDDSPIVNEAISLALFQEPGSNALATKQLVEEAMQELESAFEKDMEYAIVYDTTTFVEESIASVVQTLFEAFLLVFLVVFVFLQTWRATVIPLIAVPVSLIGTFSVMAMLGFSLNNLSLFGLVLAIGVVVDDAIVVVENVEVKLSQGLGIRDATRNAMTEVFGPVIATTLVLCAVFVPTGFIPGMSGQFYRQFALTIAVATVISSFNSLTLSPALCRLMLRPKDAKPDMIERLMQLTLGWFFALFNATIDFTIKGYGKVVSGLLRIAVIVLLIYGGMLYGTYYGFTLVPGGFVPDQDKGYLIVNAQLPLGSSLSRTDRLMERLNEVIIKDESVANTIVVPGYSAVSSSNLTDVGCMFVTLKTFDVRRGDPNLSANAAIQRLRKEFVKFPEARLSVFGAPPVDGIGSTGGFKVQVMDTTASGFEALQARSNLVIARGNAPGSGMTGLFSTFSIDQPQYYIDIDRDKVKSLSVPLDDVFKTLQVCLGSAYVNDFTLENRNWQVNVQAGQEFRIDPDQIGQLEVRNASGDMIPMSTFITVTSRTGPTKVNHYQMYPSADIIGSNPGLSSGEMIAAINQITSEELAGSMKAEWTEITLQQILAGNVAIYAFGFGSLLVFLVLAAQYESWSLPMAIILIVPMGLLCSITGVYIAEQDNNIFTQIGFLVLVGLAAKNAILIVEFAKQRQDQGLTVFEAAVDAAKARFRAIMMTAFSFILGTLPLLLATGAGAEMRVQLGTAVFSGMLGVTIFGVFLTPVFYFVIMSLVSTKTAVDTKQPVPAEAIASAPEVPVESEPKVEEPTEEKPETKEKKKSKKKKSS